MIRDPGHPDANHAEVGPNQAVITVAACRKSGAKSDRHNNTPPPHRGATSSRPPGAKSDCHGHPVSIFPLLDELSAKFGERFSVSPETRKVLYLIEALWADVDIHQIADGYIEFGWVWGPLTSSDLA